MVWYRSIKKQTTGDLLKLSIGWLKKHNFVRENAKFNGEIYWKRTADKGISKVIASSKIVSNFIGENSYIELSYTYNNENVDYKIQIIASEPNYGGKRYWFVCPQCGKKVAFLYFRKEFLCRHCLNLCYRTQQLGFTDRMMTMSKKYQNKVIYNDTKKRWVHWKTYHKLIDKADYYEEQSFINIYRKLMKIINS